MEKFGSEAACSSKISDKNAVAKLSMILQKAFNFYTEPSMGEPDSRFSGFFI